MNKEEVFSKSRNERKDEGIEFYDNKGRIIGSSLLFIVYIFILTLNFFVGKTSFEVDSLFWAFMFGNSLQKYKFTKTKLYLALTVLSAILFIAALLIYIFMSLM